MADLLLICDNPSTSLMASLIQNKTKKRRFQTGFSRHCEVFLVLMRMNVKEF